jgi:integrase
VDFEEGWIRLEPGETKNTEGRQFPLTGALRSVLEPHRAVRQRLQAEMGKIIQPLFFRYDGRYKGQRVRSFHKAWSKETEDAGHPERIFHDYRRTAVRNLVRAGVPEKVAMELTGHKTRSVFDRYNIVNEDMLAEAGEKLDAMQGGGG